MESNEENMRRQSHAMEYEDDQYILDKIKNLVIDGLITEESCHKQWYLERIIEELGLDIKNVRKQLQKEGYDFEDGTAP